MDIHTQNKERKYICIRNKTLMQEHEWEKFNVTFEILHKKNIMINISTDKHNFYRVHNIQLLNCSSTTVLKISIMHKPKAMFTFFM
jgi:hypothetical protein